MIEEWVVGCSKQGQTNVDANSIVRRSWRREDGLVCGFRRDKLEGKWLTKKYRKTQTIKRT
jgi:hypothetical protein